MNVNYECINIQSYHEVIRLNVHFPPTLSTQNSLLINLEKEQKFLAIYRKLQYSLFENPKSIVTEVPKMRFLGFLISWQTEKCIFSQLLCSKNAPDIPNILRFVV